MYNCTSSDHHQSFCLGTLPNGFQSVKVLMPMTHPKLLTAPNVPKKKKKKQKDEWNKSRDTSDDEDSVFHNPKRLQAAIAPAMK
uniref:Uncharacterized protein n=1 Tax=Romanomermis culicivorax TaxID=13658 RepID=A0A915J0C6_ROMCU